MLTRLVLLTLLVNLLSSCFLWLGRDGFFESYQITKMMSNLVSINPIWKKFHGILVNWISESDLKRVMIRAAAATSFKDGLRSLSGREKKQG